MPHPAPMSLTNDEVYALSAYIISINELKIDGEELEDDTVVDRAKFMKLEMPNRDGFVPNIDGATGPDDVRAFFHDAQNYGNGTRCMKDCFDGKPKIARISGEGISDYQPPISNKKDLPAKKEGVEVPGEEAYKASCAVCHATDAMGAPAVGDKKAWIKVLEKGRDSVYTNGINGINGMPPKGGTALDDAKFKEVVDFMITKSK
jgi:cytochrome c